MATRTVGPLVRDWRTQRRRSQLDLAIDVGVSARHLSFVETGRSRPSPELLLAVAEHLEIPLRERNTLLLAAGYAPRYAQTSLDDASMARIRTTLARLLEVHEPYPGIVIDRAWNVVLFNQPASLLTVGLPDFLTQPTLNVFRASLHPSGLAVRTRNFGEWSAYLRGELHRAASVSNDPSLLALVDEVEAYPNIRALPGWRDVRESEPTLLVPLRLDDLSFFTTLTTFGTPQDVTLSELAVELFYPADARTEEALRALPNG
jgi:transcriptional regulator with XRE-family HTH domain